MNGGPPKGELWLRSDARPALGAGNYRLELRQRIHEGNPNAPIGDDTVVRNVRVDAPRFNLAGPEVHSVFPPPNASGSFADRLAQIVLKRKTLPWERGADGAPVATRAPWLALVVLADGEANFLSGVAIADAMPAEVRTKLGVTETGTCDALEVSDTVVAKVFPYRDELDLLCHVRQVNLEDTEFAGSDDDGFLATVVSNRLPVGGQRYGAYLISLEGQLDALPVRPAAPPVGIIEQPRVYDAPTSVLRQASYEQSGGTLSLSATKQPPSYKMSARLDEPSPWQLEAAEPEATTEGTMPVASTSQAFLVHATDFPALHAAIGAPPPKLLRFPVLAHWSFTCSSEPGFQRLAAELDVGLLGTQPPAREGEPAASLEVADTGHTVIDRVTRRGEAAQAWYRGAFTPREVRRRPAAGTGETDPRARGPYHAADQAIRIAEDGREDISEAAAFELGRVLALADPVYAGTLAGWRRTCFERRRLATAKDQVPGLEDIATDDAQLSRAVASTLVTAVSTPTEPSATATPRTPLGPIVARNDLEGVLSDADPAEIADGLGVPTQLVEDVLSAGLTTTPLPRESPEPKLPTDFDDLVAHKETLAHLERKRDELRAQIEADATRDPTRGAR